jgi:glycosyltransferase involved in cell wall biosynthesis
MPTFSIVVPLYNTRDYIGEALHSIAQQTCSDFEAIVVDDGSTDGSGAIAEEFCRRDSRFKYIRQKNVGLSAARNVGIELTTGKFLYYLDSDDRITPHTLSACQAEFESNDVDVVLFDAEAFPRTSPMHERFKNYYKRPHVDGPVSSGHFIVESLRQKKYFVSACCYIAKRSVVGALRFQEGLIYEDNLFFLALMLNRKCRVSILNQDLFQRRLRPNSITSSEKTMGNYNSMNKLLYAVSRLSFAALEPPERNEVRTQIVGGFLNSQYIFSSAIGATAALRMRNVIATIFAAFRVSPRFLAPKHFLYAVWPERLERRVNSS